MLRATFVCSETKKKKKKEYWINVLSTEDSMKHSMTQCAIYSEKIACK